MAVTTNKPVAVADTWEETPVASSLFPRWTQWDLDDFYLTWRALTKEERRAARQLTPNYVRTPHGFFNLNTAEYVQLPESQMTEDDIRGKRKRERDRAKKTRF